jgi:aspartate kinase
MTYVAKFGGTSCAQPEALRRVRTCIESYGEEPLVIVVSAPGKRYPTDTKCTDLLYQWSHALSQGRKDTSTELRAELRNRFMLCVDAFALQFSIDERLDAAEVVFYEHSSVAYLASRGEAWMAELLAEWLGVPYLDAAECISIDAEGKWDGDVLHVRTTVERAFVGSRVVVPGFYGVLPSGEIATFSRGGSDITGAIIAASLKASRYDNWTDVDGVYSADPRKDPQARLLPELTYAELDTLTLSGAQVFHSHAVSPCNSAGIPIRVRNTFNPDAQGTLIR